MYAFAYNEDRFENVQTSKYGLYHFLLVFFTKDFALTNNLTSSRTLYPCLCIIPEDVLNPSQSFKNFLDHVYYFSKINTDLLFTHTTSIILFVLSIVYMFPIMQFKPDSN